MPAGTPALLDNRSAGQQPDGYGHFSGDLTDDIPTQTVPRVPENPFRKEWTTPTPELLTRLLEALDCL